MTTFLKTVFFIMLAGCAVCGSCGGQSPEATTKEEATLSSPWLCYPNTYNPLAPGFTYPNYNGSCDWQPETWWPVGVVASPHVYQCSGLPAPGFADIWSGPNQTGRCARIEAVQDTVPHYWFQYSLMVVNGFWSWKLVWPFWVHTTIRSVTIGPATSVMLWDQPTTDMPTSCGFPAGCEARTNSSGTISHPTFGYINFNTRTDYDIANMSVTLLPDGLGG